MYSDMQYYLTMNNVVAITRLVLAGLTVLMNVCTGTYRLNL